MFWELERRAAVRENKVGDGEGPFGAGLQLLFQGAFIHVIDEVIRARTELDVEFLVVLPIAIALRSISLVTADDSSGGQAEEQA